MSMSKTFIGGAICQEFKSEVPAAEEMLDHVVCIIRLSVIIKVANSFCKTA